MNRDIKFRVFGPKNLSGLKPDVFKIDLDWFYGGFIKTVEDLEAYSYELMQFTGYQDINDRDIYEGDIVALIDCDKHLEPDEKLKPKSVHVVEWGHFEDCCVEGETWVLSPSIYEPTIYSQHESLKVIGNIYENPELIPKKANRANKEASEVAHG
jgi:uncharacterized phage protein (TIGR01671 family)